MSTARNRYRCTISNTPGTSGDLTVSTAESGFVTFAAADNGLSFDVVITDGSAWEVRRDCTYTHSGTSLGRGTLEGSSTGSAISLTSSAVVTVTATAAWGNSVQLGAPNVNQTISSQKFVPSGHLTINNASGTAAATVANRLYMMPFNLKVAGTFDALGIRCGTGVAASNAIMGLYAINSSGHPAALLRETSSQSTATSGTDVVGTVSDIDLCPGWYYVAVVTSSNPALGRLDGGGSTFNLMGQVSGNLVSCNAAFYASHTFGALPNPAPSTSLTAIAIGTAVPTVFLRRKT